MGRPSIFSKDYERRMKRRKRVIFIILILTVITSLGIIYKTKFTSLFSGINLKTYVNKENNKEKSNVDKALEPEKSEDTPKEEVVVEEKYHEVSLSDGAKVRVVYETQGGTDKIKFAYCEDKKVYFNISPSYKAIVIQDEKTQELKYVDIEGNAKDITLQVYSSSTTQSSYYREQVLANNSGYLWSITPKFISDNSIAYISQLPWFGKSEKYVWIIDTNSFNHRSTGTYGENVTFGETSEEGLEVMVDGARNILKQDGTISY